MIWDNRCLLHVALTDYDQQNDPRVIWRAGLSGPQTGRLYSPELEESEALGVPVGAARN